MNFTARENFSDYDGGNFSAANFTALSNYSSTSFGGNGGSGGNNASELAGVEVFQFYYTPILVYLGTIGNGLSVFVFFRTKLRKLSSSYYLAALAVSDTVFLMSLFVVWLNMIDVDLFNQQGICQLMVYLTGVCSFLSVWLVLAFTVERFVAVRYPLLRQSVCTVSRAKIVIFALVALSMTFFSPLLVFAKVQPTQQKPYKICTVDPRWQRYANVFNVADTLLTFIVPVVVITVLNTCISRTIWKLSSVRRKLTYRGPPPAHQRRSRGFVRNNRPKSSPISQNKVTKMLLVVSTACLCLNLPSYIMRVLTYLIELQMLEDVDIPLFLTLQHYCLQLFNTNFGINFALYCISGQNFRKAIRSLFCRKKRKLRRNGTAAFTVSESRTQSSGSSISRKRRTPLPEGQELTTLHVYN